MELLATKAAIIEQDCNLHPSITNAFKRFLEMICNFRKQNVVFDETVAYYKMSDVPKDILEQRPILMDPINPYNNLLDIKRNSSLEHPFIVYERVADDALKMIRSGGKEFMYILGASYHLVLEQEDAMKKETKHVLT